MTSLAAVIQFWLEFSLIILFRKESLHLSILRMMDSTESWWGGSYLSPMQIRRLCGSFLMVFEKRESTTCQ